MTNGLGVKELNKDWGLYDQHKLAYPEAIETKGMFKTPTLRNIAHTAPYMHNGQFKTLEEVVRFYNHGGGLGLNLNIPQQTLASDSLHLNEQEIANLVSFMHTLTDTTGTVVQPFTLPDNDTEKRIWGGLY